MRIQAAVRTGCLVVGRPIIAGGFGTVKRGGLAVVVGLVVEVVVGLVVGVFDGLVEVVVGLVVGVFDGGTVGVLDGLDGVLDGLDGGVDGLGPGADGLGGMVGSVVGHGEGTSVGCGAPATTGPEATNGGLNEAGAAELLNDGGAWVLPVLGTTPPSAGTAVWVEEVGRTN
jgi:hypothetical protein